ncbi:diadenosine tetraphosphate hydrolase [Nocardioides iriomotensis]|uniref:Diadenosine tetraphosphate hydrolase n=1 Tax=Nocardioides iriomotensis TaxID=715784 RepID=A0A4Q5J7Y4_9ACTN|nr:diadenosine tetraphosphate hydrolase [Nocardioides iriomotensis]
MSGTEAVLAGSSPVTEPEDWKRDRVGSALRGGNPTVLARLDAGFAVIGDVQFLPGYCVFISDAPGADRLTDLPRDRRLAFLAGAERLAEAVENVCGRRDADFRRINLEIQGNHDAFLHAHVWPRYSWEGEFAHGPVGQYDAGRWSDPATSLGAEHDDLREELVTELARLG